MYIIYYLYIATSETSSAVVLNSRQQQYGACMTKEHMDVKCNRRAKGIGIMQLLETVEPLNGSAFLFGDSAILRQKHDSIFNRKRM